MLITLLNTELKILVKVVGKKLALVDTLNVGVQTCVFKSRMIHHYLQFIRYKVVNNPGTGGMPIHLDKSKAFNQVKNRSLAVVEAAGFGSHFYGWITDLY